MKYKNIEVLWINTRISKVNNTDITQMKSLVQNQTTKKLK